MNVLTSAFTFSCGTASHGAWTISAVSAGPVSRRLPLVGAAMSCVVALVGGEPAKR